MVVRPAGVVGIATVGRAGCAAGVVAVVGVAAGVVAAGRVDAGGVEGVRGRRLGGKEAVYGFRGGKPRRVSMKWPLALREARERSDPM